MPAEVHQAPLSQAQQLADFLRTSAETHQVLSMAAPWCLATFIIGFISFTCLIPLRLSHCALKTLDLLQGKMRSGVKQLEEMNASARRFEAVTTRLSKNIADLDDRLLKLDGQRDQIR
eukprot:EG_transcript_56255